MTKLDKAEIYTTIAMVSFALGVLVRDVAQDWRDAKKPPAPTAKAFNDPPRPRCPGEWILKRADGGKWTGACLKVASYRVPTKE